MHPYPISSTSRALFRVFIAPNLATKTPLRIQHTFLVPQSPLILPRTSVRTKTFSRKDTKRHALSDYYTFDNAIHASHVNFIDVDGQFHRYVPINEAMSSYKRTTHHLVQMSPGKVDESGTSDPNNPPTCKVISKMDLRAQHNKRVELERRKAKGLGAGPSSKNLELNWAIAPGDLKHRLEKMKEFLREGRKVEVLLGPKRGGRKATADEAKKVLDAVKEAAGECKGTGEVKSNGTVGGVLTIVFEGRKIEEKKDKQEATSGE